MRRVILIDGKNFAFRVHWSHRMLSSYGRPTSVLFGALSGLLSINNKMPNTPICLVWDGKGTTWRHELLLAKSQENSPKSHQTPGNNGYKGNREQTDIRKSVHQQVPQLIEFLDKIGVRNFKVNRLEADDLIGILATSIIQKNLFQEVIIYSNDKDFYQLMSDRIKIWKPGNNRVHILREQDIEDEYQIHPSQWAKVECLYGGHNNVPQIKSGLGPKTAAKMIAAGLEPSHQKFECNTHFVKERYEEFKPLWDDIHRNYILSKIVRRSDAKILPEWVRERVCQITDNLTRKDLCRNKECLTDENFREMINFLAEYEMGEMIGKAQRIWQLP